MLFIKFPSVFLISFLISCSSSLLIFPAFLILSSFWDVVAVKAFVFFISSINFLSISFINFLTSNSSLLFFFKSSVICLSIASIRFLTSLSFFSVLLSSLFNSSIFASILLINSSKSKSNSSSFSESTSKFESSSFNSISSFNLFKNSILLI